jgi:sec-independent protein translocase protein TatA
MFLLGFFSNLTHGGDLIIILILALLFFGAKRLPELARSLGSAINEFNKAKEDVHRQITQAVEPPPAAQPVAGQPAQAEKPVAVESPASPADSRPQA